MFFGLLLFRFCCGRVRGKRRMVCVKLLEDKGVVENLEKKPCGKEENVKKIGEFEDEPENIPVFSSFSV